MFSIGEFSKLTGLTAKALRFYHEQGVLNPSAVDDHSGYCYYAADKIEAARIITQLRELELSLTEIAEILNGFHDENDILDHLERHKKSVAEKSQHFRQIESRLDQIIRQQREARSTMKNGTFEVEEKVSDSLLIAGMRMKGRYGDCGKGFSKSVATSADSFPALAFSCITIRTITRTTPISRPASPFEKRGP